MLCILIYNGNIVSYHAAFTLTLVSWKKLKVEFDLFTEFFNMNLRLD